MASNFAVFTWMFVTASACFSLGAFVQHRDTLNKLQELIETNACAHTLRNELYDTLRLFKIDLNKMTPSRLEEIMKYGFPGMDDIRLYSDFVLSYDRKNRVAHWVYEHLRGTCVGDNHGVMRRRAEFQADMNVPSDFRTDDNDYFRSGFDRGHLAAAGNHKCQQSHCNETFFFTNIAPQVGKGFNRDAWNNLEIYVRELTERYDSVYVCTGPLYMPKQQPSGRWSVEYELIGRNHTVAVPTHFFKVIIIESKQPGGRPYLEAYIMPNKPIDDNVDLRTFLCDIREIERAAGLQFFNGMRNSFFCGINYSTTKEIFEKFS